MKIVQEKYLANFFFLAALYAFMNVAHACIKDDRPRQVLTLYPAASKKISRPLEVVVFPQSLISFLALDGAIFRVFNGRDEPNTNTDTGAFMEPLTQERYQEVLTARGINLPIEQSVMRLGMGGKPEPLVFKHFGALGLGTNYVFVTDKHGGHWAARISVIDWPVEPPKTVRIDESVDGKMVTMAYNSPVVLELPGTVGDGWSVEHSTGYLVLARLEPVGVDRVRITLERDSKAFTPSTAELTVGAGPLRSYRFKLDIPPVPKC